MQCRELNGRRDKDEFKDAAFIKTWIPCERRGPNRTPLYNPYRQCSFDIEAWNLVEPGSDAKTSKIRIRRLARRARAPRVEGSTESQAASRIRESIHLCT